MLQAKLNSVSEDYARAVARGELRADVGQQRATAALDSLYHGILGQSQPLKKRFGLFNIYSKPSDGLYLWGGVGRGKSMLMDRFVALIKPLRPTRRIHFHAFMQEVHARLFVLRAHHEGDVMEQVIAEIAREVHVLCLDEFQVSDVTDAMILARLFTGLLDAGVVVVFTSNRRPRDLYQGGLQREQFLKFLAILEARITILALEGPQDYRLAQLTSMARSYMYPRDGLADDFLMESWATLTHGAASVPLRLEVQGRTLRVDKHYHGIAWLTFGELCVRPLGANDYLMLAKVCHTLLLQGIPAMNPDLRNEAKRFVTLIDTLYDHRVKLIATAEVAPDALYPTGDGSFEFARTASRLHEMQSEAYMKLAHIC